MAKTSGKGRGAKDAAKALRTVAGRAGLAVRTAPYYASIAPGWSLGVFIGSREQSWRVRSGQKVVGVGRTDSHEGGLSYETALALALDMKAKAEAASEADAVAHDPARATFAAAFDQYLATARATKTARQMATLEQHIALAEPLREMQIASTPVARLNGWRNGLATTHTIKKRTYVRSPQTANKAFRTFKAALHAFGVAGPWKDAKPIPNAPDGKRSAMKLDAVEVARLVAAAYRHSREFGDLVRLGWLTGARYGELVALTLGNVDGDRLTLSGKTGSRTVRVSAEAAALLATILARRGDDDAALLLVQVNGRPWQDGSARYPLAKAAAAAGVRADLDFYDLRHAHVTTALYCGLPSHVVAKRCGTSVAMLEKTYAGTIARLDDELVTRLGEALRLPDVPGASSAPADHLQIAAE